MAGITDSDVPDATVPRRPSPDAQRPRLTGLRIGMFHAWFVDAERDVVTACRRAVRCLEGLGAQVTALPAWSTSLPIQAPAGGRHVASAWRRCDELLPSAAAGDPWPVQA